MKRWYTTQHLWIEEAGAGAYFVGLTKEGIAELSDIAHIELPKVGSVLLSTDPFLILESTKAAYEINLPFKALVLECYPFNLAALSNAPLVKLQMAFSEQDASIMNADSYKSYANLQ